MEYRIRMIILMVRMMAIGAIILDRTPQKRARREIFLFPARTAKKKSPGVGSLRNLETSLSNLETVRRCLRQD